MNATYPFRIWVVYGINSLRLNRCFQRQTVVGVQIVRPRRQGIDNSVDIGEWELTEVRSYGNLIPDLGLPISNLDLGIGVHECLAICSPQDFR